MLMLPFRRNLRFPSQGLALSVLQPSTSRGPLKDSGSRWVRSLSRCNKVLPSEFIRRSSSRQQGFEAAGPSEAIDTLAGRVFTGVGVRTESGQRESSKSRTLALIERPNRSSERGRL
jgi:hypothetical protein